MLSMPLIASLTFSRTSGAVTTYFVSLSLNSFCKSSAIKNTKINLAIRSLDSQECAFSKVSDQPVHTRSLISAFVSRLDTL